MMRRWSVQRNAVWAMALTCGLAGIACSLFGDVRMGLLCAAVSGLLGLAQMSMR